MQRFILPLTLIAVILCLWMQSRPQVERFFESNLANQSSRITRSGGSTDERMWRNPKNTWITTHFSDSGSGTSAIPFTAYPLTWKGKKVHAAAVHERDNRYLYHILAVTLSDGSRAYVHVMDFCNRCDGACKESVTINGRSYSKPNYLLLDIHESAFNSRGFSGKPRNTYNPSVKSVGVLTPNQIKGLPKKYYVDGRKRCDRSSLRKADCNNNASKDDFSKYCSWSSV